MAGDKILIEALGRVEAATTAIRNEQATQTALLRSTHELLTQILEAVTPDPGAEPGVALDELLAQLIVLMRDQGKKLDRVLAVLEPPADSADSGNGARPGQQHGKPPRAEPRQ
jgi:hypothetical protein